MNAVWIAIPVVLLAGWKVAYKAHITAVVVVNIVDDVGRFRWVRLVCSDGKDTTLSGQIAVCGVLSMYRYLQKIPGNDHVRRRRIG